MKKSFFPENKEQKKSLLEAISKKNPNVLNNLQNVVGGAKWDDSVSWPESTFVDNIFRDRI